MGAAPMSNQIDVSDATPRDLAIEGKDFATQYKALHIAAKGGIDEDEPLWWTFVALGYLETLAGEIPSQIEKSTREFTETFDKARRAIETSQQRYSELSNNREHDLNSQNRLHSDLSSKLDEVGQLLKSRQSASLRRLLIGTGITCFLAGIAALAIIQAVFQPPESVASASEDELIMAEYESHESFYTWPRNRKACILQGDICQINMVPKPE